MNKLIAKNQLTVTNLLERAETRRETFYKLTNEGALGNLVVESKLSKGWLDANGKGQLLGPSANAEYTTDFIQVVAGKAYTFQWWATVSEGQKCWEAWQFYDSNKTPFGSRGGYGEYGSDGEQHGKRTITAPANACYIRLSYRSFGNGHMMFEAGAGSASFEPSFDDSLKKSNRNIMQRTDKPFVMGYGITNTTWDDDKKWAYLDLTDPNVNTAKANEILPQGQFYNFKPTKGMTYTQSILIDTDATFNPYGQPSNTWFTSQGHNSQKGHFEQLSETTYRFWSTYTWELEDIALRAFDWSDLHTVLGFRNSGTYLAFYKPKLETSEQPSEWFLAPEDLGWSMDTLVPTQLQRYLWKFEYIYYSDGSVEITQPVNLSIAGADADTTGITEALDKTKQELTALSEKTEKVRDDSLAAVNEAKQKLSTVANDLSKAKTDLQNAVGVVADDLNAAKQDLQNAVSEVDTKAANLQGDLTKAKQDLQTQASQLTAQANAQSELTNRVSSVEESANGTKTTVSELSKTVAQNGKDITSVTARTKTVEDDLLNTKTTLSQVQTTANSANQKTATLETGLNGLTARFDSLKVGTVNLLKNTKSFTGSNITGWSTILSETYNDCAVRYFKSNTATSSYQDITHFLNCVYPKLGGEYVLSFWAKGAGTFTAYFYGDSGYLQVASIESSQGRSGTASDGSIDFTLTEDWQRYWIKYKLKTAPSSATAVAKRVLFRHIANGKEEEIWLAGCKLEEGNVATDYNPNEADIEQKVAEYKQTADQNYASLQTTVQNLDGTVQQNKTTAEQTAAGFKTRIESLETYKDGEATRANQYFESAKTETARQLTAERTAIAKDYVAKSTYTSDVTGVRNDLTATTTTANTTKTNLANYQASNDKAVANLQSNLQTANGNISNLQTKVEAVPGQITSAVSAVEGKIPTSKSFRNLYIIANSSDGYLAYGSTNLGAASPVYKERTSDYIPVEAGEKYAFQVWATLPENHQGWRAWQFYNEDKSLNGVRTAGNYTPDYQCIRQTLTVPSGAKWLRVSARLYNDGKIMVEKGNEHHDYMLAPEDTATQINSPPNFG
jgi:methyl-accepting chemotaxis protein